MTWNTHLLLHKGIRNIGLLIIYFLTRKSGTTRCIQCLILLIQLLECNSSSSYSFSLHSVPQKIQITSTPPVFLNHGQLDSNTISHHLTQYFLNGAGGSNGAKGFGPPARCRVSGGSPRLLVYYKWSLEKIWSHPFLNFWYSAAKGWEKCLQSLLTLLSGP